MITSEELDALAAEGCTAEQVIAVFKVHLTKGDDRVEHRRKLGRLRQRAYRKRKAGDACDASLRVTGTVKERSPTPPKENYIYPLNPPEGAVVEDFDRFWDAYPRKANRPKARRAFNRALKTTSFDEIMAGLGRVIAGWDDPAFTPNPAAWLIGEGWNDPVRVKPRPRRKLSRKARGRREGRPTPEMTPERRAAAVRSYLATDLWNASWGKRPTMAEIAAAGGSP